jgi:hypothetical protein
MGSCWLTGAQACVAMDSPPLTGCVSFLGSLSTVPDCFTRLRLPNIRQPHLSGQIADADQPTFAASATSGLPGCRSSPGCFPLQVLRYGGAKRGAAQLPPAALQQPLPEPTAANPLDPVALAAHLRVQELHAPPTRPPGYAFNVSLLWVLLSRHRKSYSRAVNPAEAAGFQSIGACPSLPVWC